MTFFSALHTRLSHFLRIPRQMLPKPVLMRSLCVLCCAVTMECVENFSSRQPRLYAQLQLREPVLWRAGVFGNYGLNFHQALFDSLSGLVNSSPPFRGGQGTGFTLGAFFEKPFSHDFSLAGRISLSQLDGTMRASEEVAFGFNGSAEIATIESRFIASLTALSLEPLGVWHPFPNASVYLGGRIGIGFGTLFQDLSIINDPTGGMLLFPDSNQRTIVVNPTRTIPNVFVPNVSAIAGLSYAIPLDIDETLFLAPEFWYAHNFTPFVSNLPENQTWTINSLRGGISFRYSPEAARRYLPPAIVRTAETPRLSINITPVALDSSGAESPLLRLKVEEVLTKQMHPLLPMIFFDKNSEALPSRYQRLQTQQISGFQEKMFAKWGTLEIYYHLLNIIGKRLKDSPNATLRITGCVSSDEYTSDSSHVMLATRRAEAVMTYLRDVWRISSDRLIVLGRGLPENPTNQDVAAHSVELANTENRRVELFSEDEKILRPLVIADTLLESTPPAVKFFLRAGTKSRITKWRFKIDQGKQPILLSGGAGQPDNDLFWHPSREHRSVPRTEEAIRCNFDFLEEEGEGGTATISIPIEQVSIAKKRRKILLEGNNESEKSIDVYRFIRFIGNSAELTSEHWKILSEIAATKIESQAKIFITGYTDRGGNTAQNLLLSGERARNVAKALANTVSAGNALPAPILAGRGGILGIYHEANPEGRFYSRTVEVRIETLSSVK